MHAAPGDPPVDQADEQREVVEEFWPDGKPRLHREVLRSPAGALVDDGTYTRWYENGLKEYQATYVRGRLHGVETAWHQNGQKRTEQHYDHGARHGARYDWDEQGRLRREEHYVKDRPHGTWTIWKPDGSIKWQARFDHGKPLP
jgi:YD repeat-containing protein